jgi:hypothetical protein
MDQQEGASGVATAAKDQAGQVGQTAAQAGGQVAQTTKEQAQNVVGEAKQQARDLVGEARMQVRDQAGTQKGRAVDSLRTLADELNQMAQQGGQSGIATEVARQASQRAHGLADHLDRHEPAELLDQVRSYARRRPVAFLAGAAVLGVLAGRMTRSLASGQDSGPRQLTGADTTPALPASTTYPAGYETGGYSTGSADYPAGTSAGYAEPGYPAGGAGGAPAGGYQTGYEAGDQPGYGSSGFGEAGEPGYETGYPASPDTGYVAGEEPGAQPPRGYEGGAEDPTWRTP